jgi:beta-phosphoglucomutase-like phosphatase (HAD superfamily)
MLPMIVSGLPDKVQACLFDLDGVLTRTATVHAAAWKEMFDAYLGAWAERERRPYVPLDAVADSDEYVDGMPLYDGVRSLLAARGRELPEGDRCDPPDAETICGLGNRKNEMVLALIRDHGVQPYEGSVRHVRAVRDAGLPTAVVSSSTNCPDALAGVAAGHVGGFGFVVGVDRVGQVDALKAHGADVVVTDLAELLVPVSP